LQRRALGTVLLLVSTTAAQGAVALLSSAAVADAALSLVYDTALRPQYRLHNSLYRLLQSIVLVTLA